MWLPSLARCWHEPYRYLRYLFEKLPETKTDAELRALLPYGHQLKNAFILKIDINLRVVFAGSNSRYFKSIPKTLSQYILSITPAATRKSYRYSAVPPPADSINLFAYISAKPCINTSTKRATLILICKPPAIPYKS